MRFRVVHETLYRYSVPVGLAPHRLRLEPQLPAGQVTVRTLGINPRPAWQRSELDEFGNWTTVVGFDGESPVLRIESRFIADTVAPTPLATGLLPALPWPREADRVLDACLREPMPDDAVTSFAHMLAAGSGHDPLVFLDRLCQTLHERTRNQLRLDGDAQPPALTLASRGGACRDVTVLFMAACRTQHLPARFVSGYQADAETAHGQRFLHAWPEVHLPGIGWRGWDPTHGTRVGEDHVALCAAPDQARTMPVEGGFYANGVTATLDCRVQIDTG